MLRIGAVAAAALLAACAGGEQKTSRDRAEASVMLEQGGVLRPGTSVR